MAADAWADMLIELYPEDSDAERLANLMLFITDNPQHQSPLNKLVRVRPAFKAYLEKIQAQIDGTLMQYLDENRIVEAGHGQGFQFENAGEACMMFSTNGMMTLQQLSKSTQKVIINSICKVLKQSNSKTVQSLSGMLVEMGPDKLMRYARYGGVALMGVQLGWKAIKSMKQWYCGEISGERACKQVVDCLGSLGGGFAGGEIGFMIGSAAIGPVGGIGGALVGGLAGSLVAGSFTDRLTQWCFDVPKEVACENAYNFVGVRRSAENHEVNKKFRELCLKYHPDKGGKQEDFVKLQMSMQFIRLSRGQA